MFIYVALQNAIEYLPGTFAKTLKRKIAPFFFLDKFLLSLKRVTFQTAQVRVKKQMDFSAIVLGNHGD